MVTAVNFAEHIAGDCAVFRIMYFQVHKGVSRSTSLVLFNSVLCGTAVYRFRSAECMVDACDLAMLASEVGLPLGEAACRSQRLPTMERRRR